MRVFPTAPWYYGNELHEAFLAAGTTRDVYPGEFYHDVLQWVGDFEHRGGYCEQSPDEVQIECSITIGQKAIVSDSDKA